MYGGDATTPLYLSVYFQDDEPSLYVNIQAAIRPHQGWTRSTDSHGNATNVHSAAAGRVIEGGYVLYGGNVVLLCIYIYISISKMRTSPRNLGSDSASSDGRHSG